MLGESEEAGLITENLVHALRESAAGIEGLSRLISAYLKLKSEQQCSELSTTLLADLQLEAYRISLPISGLLRRATRAIQSPDLKVAERMTLLQNVAIVQIAADGLQGLVRAVHAADSITYIGD